MIILSNGEKWVLDESEWKKAGIEYEEACKGNLPITDARKFIETLCAYYDEENERSDEKPVGVPEFLTPLKLTEGFDGTGDWVCNFDVLSEVLGDTAVKEFHNAWSSVYEMPWGEVIVVYSAADFGGYDAAIFVKVYPDFESYLKAAKEGE